jgi:hypothetical protein
MTMDRQRESRSTDGRFGNVQIDGPCVAEVGVGEGEGVPVAGRGAADGDDGGARGAVAGLRRHQVHLAPQRRHPQERL